MQFDLTIIFEAIITILVALVVKVAIPWLKAKLDDAQEKKVDYWVKLAVAAYEQIYSTMNGEKRGKEKKAAVIAWLNEHNIVIDESVLDAKIEYAVYALKNGIVGDTSTNSITLAAPTDKPKE